MRNKDMKIILCRHGQVFSVADPDMLIAFLAEQSFYFPQKFNAVAVAHDVVDVRIDVIPGSKSIL